VKRKAIREQLVNIFLKMHFTVLELGCALTERLSRSSIFGANFKSGQKR